MVTSLNVVEFFIKELQRVSSKGYIELPTILEDNLVFENKKDHLWNMEFDDDKKQLIVSKKIQFLEPILTVSSSKDLPINLLVANIVSCAFVTACLFAG